MNKKQPASNLKPIQKKKQSEKTSKSSVSPKNEDIPGKDLVVNETQDDLKSKNVKKADAESSEKTSTVPLASNQLRDKDGFVYNVLTGKFDIAAADVAVKQDVSHVPLTMGLQFASDIGVSNSASSQFLKKFGEERNLYNVATARKALPVIDALSRTVHTQHGIPDSWGPYIEIISRALTIAKVFTPAHVDVMIDKILLAIQIWSDKNK